MPDRENVIKGLEYCMGGCQVSCFNCPYRDPGEVSPDCLDNCRILQDAVELLKEQEPIEPSATDSGVRIEYNCGSCGRWFCFKSKIHPEMDFRTRYCPHCGRKAKW